MKILLFLALPAFAVASINVEIHAALDGKDQSLTFYGNQIDIISDKERDSFGVYDSKLKDSVRSYFGKRPDDAYVKSPTPWGDLYKTYGWDQVTRTLVPRSGRIVGLNSQPVIVMKQVFENNSTKPSKFKVDISQEVTNTVTSTWSTGGELTVGMEISYEVNFEVAKGGGTTKMSYTNSWGHSTEKSESITVGASSGMEIELDPGQSVVAELHATRGTMKVEMQYDASLSGAVAVNYASTYKGHHFWALPVGGVMSSGGSSNSVRSTEVLEVGFYSESQIIVRDRSTNKKLMKYAL